MTVPAVDAEIRTLLDTADTGVFPVYGLDAVLADPERYALLRERPDTPADDRVQVRDLFIPGPGGQLRLRVYRPDTRPDTRDNLPMILYVHGGAFTYGSPRPRRSAPCGTPGTSRPSSSPSTTASRPNTPTRPRPTTPTRP
ncbi:lipase [Streptomyces chrestomyceticus JCM 4735]|uniref:Lipase n=1 Tax=Streptomyces chrestomyceticus JCM 4735 TaxID=1306181 RepID=A0A7U9KWK1_9ACTN|nr:hypothetical protein [Streptomyces chrestomyceticus]GCD36107.1 lipase [Streptomyces chrestomyceticus JCM 4735]